MHITEHKLSVRIRMNKHDVNQAAKILMALGILEIEGHTYRLISLDLKIWN